MSVRVLYVVFAAFCLFVLGCSEDSSRTCTTRSTTYDLCFDYDLYRCPVGQGEEVEADLVEHCDDRGLVCLTSTRDGVTEAACAVAPH